MEDDDGGKRKGRGEFTAASRRGSEDRKGTIPTTFDGGRRGLEFSKLESTDRSTDSTAARMRKESFDTGSCPDKSCHFPLPVYPHRQYIKPPREKRKNAGTRVET